MYPANGCGMRDGKSTDILTLSRCNLVVLHLHAILFRYHMTTSFWLVLIACRIPTSNICFFKLAFFYVS